jgi:hypothetical protein
MQGGGPPRQAAGGARIQLPLGSPLPTLAASASSSRLPTASRLPNFSMLSTRTGVTVTPTLVERLPGSSNSTSAPALPFLSQAPGTRRL